MPRLRRERSAPSTPSKLGRQLADAEQSRACEQSPANPLGISAPAASTPGRQCSVTTTAPGFNDPPLLEAMALAASRGRKVKNHCNSNRGCVTFRYRVPVNLSVADSNKSSLVTWPQGVLGIRFSYSQHSKLCQLTQWVGWFLYGLAAEKLKFPLWGQGARVTLMNGFELTWLMPLTKFLRQGMMNIGQIELQGRLTKLEFTLSHACRRATKAFVIAGSTE
jgi:hypothetical protein